MPTNMILSAATPANRGHRLPAPTVLIYGSAIKTSANSPGFTNMQFSNRRQTGGLRIMSLAVREKILNGTSLVTSHSSLATAFLTATVDSQNLSHLTANTPVTKILTATKPPFPQNVARVFRPEAFPPNLGFSPRPVLPCLREPNEANIGSAQMKAARIE